MEGRVQQSLERRPKRNNRKQDEQGKCGMPLANRLPRNGRGLIREICLCSLVFKTDILLGGSRIEVPIHGASDSLSSTESEDF